MVFSGKQNLTFLELGTICQKKDFLNCKLAGFVSGGSRDHELLAPTKSCLLKTFAIWKT